MEVWATSNCWRCTFQSMGFLVRLIPTQHVKAFTHRQENDADDALANQIRYWRQNKGLRSPLAFIFYSSDCLILLRLQNNQCSPCYTSHCTRCLKTYIHLMSAFSLRNKALQLCASNNPNIKCWWQYRVLTRLLPPRFWVKWMRSSLLTGANYLPGVVWFPGSVAQVENQPNPHEQKREPWL